ncbi:MAG: AI-2E family transporter [Gammaproteobacteria bacterium]
MNHLGNVKPTHYLISGFLLCGLLLLAFIVLREFLLTLTWAFIIAYVMWPPYCWLRQRLKNDATASAAVMTAVIAAIIVFGLYWLADLLREELKTTYQGIVNGFDENRIRLPDFFVTLPWLGDYLQDGVNRLNNDRAGVVTELVEWSKQWLGELAKFVGGLGHYVMKLGLILVTLFFCFRDGDEAVRQLHTGLVSFLGKYQHVYLQAAGQTTRAVVYGLVLAALGQGLMAGIGYAVAGVDAPVLFGSITALLALIPMGAALIWLPLSIGLILMDRFLPGMGLLLWGVLVVSTVDNVIRPIVISGASQVPFLVVMFGVLGGLTAFGAVGLFLGPVILAVLLSVWQAWLKQQGRN